MQSVILLRTTQAKLDQQTVDDLKANTGLRSKIWDLFQTGMCCAQSQIKAQTWFTQAVYHHQAYTSAMQNRIALLMSRDVVHQKALSVAPSLLHF